MVKGFGHIPVSTNKESSCKEIILLNTLIVAILQRRVFCWKDLNNQCVIIISLLLESTMAVLYFENIDLQISLILLRWWTLFTSNIIVRTLWFTHSSFLNHLFVCFFTECFSSPSYLRIFFIIFIVTFLIGLLKVLIIRQVILQWNSNKIKSSADYRVSASKKVSEF